MGRFCEEMVGILQEGLKEKADMYQEHHSGEYQDRRDHSG